jgi:hypothetical protein
VCASSSYINTENSQPDCFQVINADARNPFEEITQLQLDLKKIEREKERQIA